MTSQPVAARTAATTSATWIIERGAGPKKHSPRTFSALFQRSLVCQIATFFSPRSRGPTGSVMPSAATDRNGTESAFAKSGSWKPTRWSAPASFVA